MKEEILFRKSATVAATGLICTLPGSLRASSRILGANERYYRSHRFEGYGHVRSEIFSDE